MPTTIPLDVYKLIFDCFSIRQYNIVSAMSVNKFIDVNITPCLSSDVHATLHALSLTCKSFNEFARAISLRDSFIRSFSDFAELCGMARNCRLLPIETLNIYAETRNDGIQDFTTAEFLFIMRKCVRLRILGMYSPLLTLSNLSRATESLAQCGALANLTSLELRLRDYSDDFPMPDARDLVQVLLLMANLTVLHIDIQYPPDNIHEPSTPPPFQLTYLVINYGYLNTRWLTSTSHNYLKVAHISDVPAPESSLDLNHPWTELRYLSLASIFDLETMVKTLRCCPNINFLATRIEMPMIQEEEQDLVNSFDALQTPLLNFTLIFSDFLSSSDLEEEEKADFTILAAAIENHPFLAELGSFMIELGDGEYHEELELITLPLKRACEANKITFVIVCDSQCPLCGEPPYGIPLPDEYDLDLDSVDSNSDVVMLDVTV